MLMIQLLNLRSQHNFLKQCYHTGHLSATLREQYLQATGKLGEGLRMRLSVSYIKRTVLQATGKLGEGLGMRLSVSYIKRTVLQATGEAG